jgi:hypothetical protein
VTVAAASMTGIPALHVPDEPLERQARWLKTVLDGGELGEVLVADDGVAPWLWARWRVLASAGMREADLAAVVLAYRRELWLWLAGERTWGQCCSGLIGRIDRRLAS